MRHAETWIVLGGVFNLGFAVFHIFFWRLFRWGEELPRLSFLNRQIVQVLNLCLMAALLMMAWVSFVHPRELAGTPLGRTLLVAFGAFWIRRMIEQPVFFGWRSGASLAMTVAFLVGGLLYLVPAL
jgi:hypothetical protein